MIRGARRPTRASSSASGPGGVGQDHDRGGGGRAGGAAAGGGRWCAPSIRRRGWPTRWGRAASGPSRSRCRRRPAARWASTARRPAARRCASTPSGRSRALVEEQVTDPEMRRRIFDNTHLPADHHDADRVAGVRGDAGAARASSTAGEYDLVVLDTPPTANALDFLEAPAPDRGGGLQPGAASGSRGRAEKASGGSRCSGCARAARWCCGGWPSSSAASFLDDIGAFLVDFQVVLGGFLARAEAIDKLLRGPDGRLPAGAGAGGGRRSTRRCISTTACATRGIPLGGLRRQPRAAAAGARRGGGDRGGAARATRRWRGCRRRPSTTRRRGWRRSRGAFGDAARVRAARAGAAGARAPRHPDHRGAAARSRRRQPGGAARRGRAPFFGRSGAPRASVEHASRAPSGAPARAGRTNSATASARRATAAAGPGACFRGAREVVGLGGVVPDREPHERRVRLGPPCSRVARVAAGRRVVERDAVAAPAGGGARGHLGGQARDSQARATSSPSTALAVRRSKPGSAAGSSSSSTGTGSSQASYFSGCKHLLGRRRADPATRHRPRSTDAWARMRATKLKPSTCEKRASSASHAGTPRDGIAARSRSASAVAPYGPCRLPRRS